MKGIVVNIKGEDDYFKALIVDNKNFEINCK